MLDKKLLEAARSRRHFSQRNGRPVIRQAAVPLAIFATRFLADSLNRPRHEGMMRHSDTNLRMIQKHWFESSRRRRWTLRRSLRRPEQIPKSRITGPQPLGSNRALQSDLEPVAMAYQLRFTLLKHIGGSCCRQHIGVCSRALMYRENMH